MITHKLLKRSKPIHDIRYSKPDTYLGVYLGSRGSVDYYTTYTDWEMELLDISRDTPLLELVAVLNCEGTFHRTRNNEQLLMVHSWNECNECVERDYHYSRTRVQYKTHGVRV